MKDEKVVLLRHPDACDWQDVVRSHLGVPSDVTEADFDGYHEELAEVIPFRPRRTLGHP
jgi:hypothetical protein